MMNSEILQKSTGRREIEASKAEIILSRRNFWDFCYTLSPDFYKHEHLEVLCNTLDDFYNDKLLKDDGTPYEKIMIQMPPQHGKSRTLINFCEWALGKNNAERIILGSYNDTTAVEFSKYVRNGIMERKTSEGTVYSDIFDARIKHGDASKSLWALEGQHFSYLGAGVGGSITSKGGTILIIDDPVKGAIEALNEVHLKKIWTWYTGTFLSRVSAKGGKAKHIINHTRWSKNDLSGRILSSDKKDDWYVLKMEAFKDGKMLCEDLLSREEYESRKSYAAVDTNTNMVFFANYHQTTIDAGNLLYNSLKTYTPEDCPHIDDFDSIQSYTDTADTGEDFLCCIVYGEYNGQVYILDVLYTDEPMEITEPLHAELMQDSEGYPLVGKATIESNSGGRGFMRAVKRICQDELNNDFTTFKPLTQSKNKQARINSMSTWVVRNINFPNNWMHKWPKFYDAITTYQRKGVNIHDDAPDTLTGVAESISRRKTMTEA